MKLFTPSRLAVSVFAQTFVVRSSSGQDPVIVMNFIERCLTPTPQLFDKNENI
jgi:hypothetical protein